MNTGCETKDHWGLLSAHKFLLVSYSANAIDNKVIINQAINQIKSKDVVLSSNCKGRIDQPHISRHVKGTVNVILSIKCPNQFTTITGIFFRSPIKSPADVRIGHVNGRGQTKMNLAIPCLSNEGASVHTYHLTGTFIATRHLPVVKNYSWPVPC